MWKDYQKFDLIKDKYYIQYIYNEKYGVFARIWFYESFNPIIQKEVGKLLTYFEASPPEGEYAHWLAECYLVKDHFKPELIDAIGVELLNKTSCEKPFKLLITKGDTINNDLRKYGEIYTPDFYNS